MPDLLTHCIAGYCVARPRIAHPLAYLFIVGNVLPDLFTRPFSIMWPASHCWVMPLHTPIGVFLLCGVLAQFFKTGERVPVFCSMFTGALLHLLLDFSQKHVAGGYFLFFPLSWTTYEGGLWWPEDSLSILPLLLALLLLLEIGLYHRRRRRRRSTGDVS